MRHWLLLGVAIGMSLWAKYFVVVLAVPLALFILLDRDARKSLATPGPYIAAAVALVTMAPHLVWLVQNDFLPFAYAEHRALPSRGLIDHVWHPLQFAVSQAFFLIPSALIALPLFVPAAECRCARIGRVRHAHRDVARLRADRDGAGDVCDSAAAAPLPCGAIRCGCSLGVWAGAGLRAARSTRRASRA